MTIASATELSVTEIEERLVLAQIDRAQEETRTFVAEQRKLIAESFKFADEGRKFRRDPWLAAVVALSAVVGGFIAKSFH